MLRARLICTIAGLLLVSLAAPTAAAPDPAFTKWLEGLWPDAQKQGRLAQDLHLVDA